MSANSTRPDPVPSHNLNSVGAFRAKHINRSAKRILPEPRAHEWGKTVGTLADVDRHWPRRPYARRRPPTNEAASSAGRLSFPERTALRSANRCWDMMSWRRATSDTTAPGANDRYDPAFLRTVPAPAPSDPDADVHTTSSLRRVNSMVNNICEPSVRLSSHLPFLHARYKVEPDDLTIKRPPRLPKRSRALTLARALERSPPSGGRSFPRDKIRSWRQQGRPGDHERLVLFALWPFATYTKPCRQGQA